MRRREFITLVGGAWAAWPMAARAQQQGERKKRIGVLISRAENDPEGQSYVTAFRQGLEQSGWLPGRNVEIDYRWMAGNDSLSPALVKELIGLKPDVLVINSTGPLIAARQAAAGAIPIVMAAVADPVAQGFVQSLERPGGNITGFAVEEPAMGAKWVELLKEIAPKVRHITAVYNPQSAPFAKMFLPSIENVRASFSVELAVTYVQNEDDLDKAITVAAREQNGGLLFLPDSILASRR